MKKILTFLICLLCAAPARAQMPYIEEVRALGAIAGQGLACGSAKYDTFELLARAILLTKSPSDKLQNDAVYAYSEEKANAYISKEMDGFYECTAINRRFDNQEIFKAVLYADGTIKMPDGQVLTPRRPYDATMIYKKKPDSLKEARAIYNGREAKILKVDVRDDTLASMQKAQSAQPQAPLPGSIGRISRRR